MKKDQVLKAWRNADEYQKLSATERAALPESPAAFVEVDDEILMSVTGGCCPPGRTTAICTPCPPMHCF